MFLTIILLSWLIFSCNAYTCNNIKAVQINFRQRDVSLICNLDKNDHIMSPAFVDGKTGQASCMTNKVGVSLWASAVYD